MAAAIDSGAVDYHVAMVDLGAGSDEAHLRADLYDATVAFDAALAVLDDCTHRLELKKCEF